MYGYIQSMENVSSFSLQLKEKGHLLSLEDVMYTFCFDGLLDKGQTWTNRNNHHLTVGMVYNTTSTHLLNSLVVCRKVQPAFTIWNVILTQPCLQKITFVNEDTAVPIMFF